MTRYWEPLDPRDEARRKIAYIDGELARGDREDYDVRDMRKQRRELVERFRL